MSNQLCPVQSLIERTINSDSFYSLISKLKERVVCSTRSFGFSGQLSTVSCKSVHCHSSGDASGTLRKHQSHPACGRAKRLHGGNHASCFMSGNRSTAVAPQDRADSPVTFLLSKNLRCCAYSSTRGKVFIAQF
jgi:hypothetical protein